MRFPSKRGAFSATRHRRSHEKAPPRQIREPPRCAVSSRRSRDPGLRRAAPAARHRPEFRSAPASPRRRTAPAEPSYPKYIPRLPEISPRTPRRCEAPERSADILRSRFQSRARKLSGIRILQALRRDGLPQRRKRPRNRAAFSPGECRGSALRRRFFSM